MHKNFTRHNSHTYTHKERERSHREIPTASHHKYTVFNHTDLKLNI